MGRHEAAVKVIRRWITDLGYSHIQDTQCEQLAHMVLDAADVEDKGPPSVPEAKPENVEPAAEEPPVEKKSRSELEDMTKAELGEYAEDMEIEVDQHWTKDEIIDEIVKGQRGK